MGIFDRWKPKRTEPPKTEQEEPRKIEKVQTGDDITLTSGEIGTVVNKRGAQEWTVQIGRGNEFRYVPIDQIAENRSFTRRLEAQKAGIRVRVEDAMAPDKMAAGASSFDESEHGVNPAGRVETLGDEGLQPDALPQGGMSAEIDFKPTVTAAAVPPERRSFFKRHGGKLALAAAGLMLAAGLAREYVGNLFSSDDSRGADTELRTDKPAVPDLEGVVNAAKITTEAASEAQSATPKTIHVDAVPGKGAIAAVQKAAREKGVRISADLAEDVASGLYGGDENFDTFDIAGKTVDVNDAHLRLKTNPEALVAFDKIFDTGASEVQPPASDGPSESGTLVADAGGDDEELDMYNDKISPELPSSTGDGDDLITEPPLPMEKPPMDHEDKLDVPLNSNVEFKDGTRGYVQGVNDDGSLLVHAGNGDPVPGTFTVDDINRVITEGTYQTIGKIVAQRERNAAIAKAAVDPTEAPDKTLDFTGGDDFEMESPKPKEPEVASWWQQDPTAVPEAGYVEPPTPDVLRERSIINYRTEYSPYVREDAPEHPRLIPQHGDQVFVDGHGYTGGARVEMLFPNDQDLLLVDDITGQWIMDDNHQPIHFSLGDIKTLRVPYEQKAKAPVVGQLETDPSALLPEDPAAKMAILAKEIIQNLTDEEIDGDSGDITATQLSAVLLKSAGLMPDTLAYLHPERPAKKESMLRLNEGQIRDIIQRAKDLPLAEAKKIVAFGDPSGQLTAIVAQSFNEVETRASYAYSTPDSNTDITITDNRTGTKTSISRGKHGRKEADVRIEDDSPAETR